MKDMKKGQELLEALEYLDPALIEESSFKNRRRRKVPLLILVAALVLCFGMMTMAARDTDWSIDILNYMGLSQSDTTQLENGMVKIGAVDEKEVKNEQTGKMETIRFTVDSSIGDQRNAYILIKTNIQVPENYDEKKDYFYVDQWDYQIRRKKNGPISINGGSMESQIVDGYLCFMMYVEDCKDLSTNYVTVSLGDIRLAHDRGWKEGDLAAEEEKIYDAIWQMEWKYSYKTVQRKVAVKETVKAGGKKCKIRSVTVTPLEVKINGRLSYKDKNLNIDLIDISEIHLKDGSIIRSNQRAGGGGISTGFGGLFGLIPRTSFTVYESIEAYQTVLNPKDVIAVKVSGKVIPLQ